MYTLIELKEDRELWSGINFIPTKCSWCEKDFEVKYGTLYNVIRRDAEGIFCCRKCAGASRAFSTQEKFKKEGGKTCKRCSEFKSLDSFSSLPNPPYFRSECKGCHNFKPARRYGSYKEKAARAKIPFELSMNQFIYFWNLDCYYCDSQITSTRLNLINNSAGYILSNVVSCCRQCQKFKGDLSHQKFINLCSTISNNVKENGVKDE